MNREIYPGGTPSPLTGDVQSTPGNIGVKVTGIINLPVTNTFLNGGEVLQYDPNSHSWVPRTSGFIQINGVTVSDDPLISVNTPKQILVNGA
jgi:hypothetical protein